MLTRETPPGEIGRRRFRMNLGQALEKKCIEKAWCSNASMDAEPHHRPCVCTRDDNARATKGMKDTYASVRTGGKKDHGLLLANLYISRFRITRYTIYTLIEIDRKPWSGLHILSQTISSHALRRKEEKVHTLDLVSVSRRALQSHMGPRASGVGEYQLYYQKRLWRGLVRCCITQAIEYLSKFPLSFAKITRQTYSNVRCSRINHDVFPRRAGIARGKAAGGL